jgi:hypothetical protein
MDFSHDNLMIAVYGALGLYAGIVPPPPTGPADPNRTWRMNELVPFSSRMVTERLKCKADGNRKQGTYVRVLVNDQRQPLDFCGATTDGMCAIDTFVRSQDYARNDGYGVYPSCFSSSAL